MQSIESIRDNFLHRMQSNIRSFADLLNHIDESISCGTAEISTVTKLDSLINEYYRSVSDGQEENNNVSFLDTTIDERYRDIDRDLSSETSRESDEESVSAREEESSEERSDNQDSQSEEDSDSEVGLNFMHRYTNESSSKSDKYSNFSGNIINNEIDISVFNLSGKKVIGNF